jgi:hypothetical protein
MGSTETPSPNNSAMQCNDDRKQKQWRQKLRMFLSNGAIKNIRNAYTKMYWLLGRKSKLSTSNKLNIYKTILIPIWATGIQLWGTASTSNIEILKRFQSKALSMTVDTPWYVPNTVIRRDLQTPTVKEKIRRYSSQYSARLSAHPNGLVVNLIELPDNKTPAK